MGDDNPPFLDHAAQNILQRQKTIHKNLGWRNDKWILDTSKETSQIYFWTFAGDKINRALALLFAVVYGEDPDYDYKSIILKRRIKIDLSVNSVKNWILSLTSQTEQQLVGAIEAKITVKWFSKFSDCLPEQLAKKTIQEKGIDVGGIGS